MHEVNKVVSLVPPHANYTRLVTFGIYKNSHVIGVTVRSCAYNASSLLWVGRGGGLSPYLIKRKNYMIFEGWRGGGSNKNKKNLHGLWRGGLMVKPKQVWSCTIGPENMALLQCP